MYHLIKIFLCLKENILTRKLFKFYIGLKPLGTYTFNKY